MMRSCLVGPTNEMVRRFFCTWALWTTCEGSIAGLAGMGFTQSSRHRRRQSR